jgi:hypothetical protein
MASGNYLLQLAFAGAILGATFGGAALLKRNRRHVTIFTIAMTLLAYWSGPPVFGRDWYYEGFPAGACMGFLVGGSLADQELSEKNPGPN